MAQRKKKKSSDASLELGLQPIAFDEPDGRNVEQANADADALLALFYFRRILDHQALSLLVRYFHPLSSFFEASERELKLFFAEHRHLRGFVDCSQLVSRSGREAALKYGDRQKDIMYKKLRGRLLVEAHPSFPSSLYRSRLPIDWVFSYPLPTLEMPSPIVAVIGSRNSSQQQLNAAKEIAYAVGSIGGTIVTGLATGADIAAHEAALETEASILAVLGSGIAKVYPSEHTKHVRELLSGRGTIFTEVPPDYAANGDAFVLRNRIVAAMSDCVVAVSGKYASGTSHTIRFAFDANVPIYSIDPDGPQSGISRLVTELKGTVINCNQFAENIISRTSFRCL